MKEVKAMITIWNFLENTFGFMGAYAICIFGCGLCFLGALWLVMKLVIEWYQDSYGYFKSDLF